jgi:SAM-dependent MidA family methyltransferase
MHATRARTGPTTLATIISEHLCAQGPIPFADYMEACLYHPEYGYYTRAQQEPRWDYFTSVDASPLFGRLLARQFREMWEQLGRPEEFLLVEVGAGIGALAAQILDFVADELPEFCARLRYVAVERSAARRAAQAAALRDHLAAQHCVSASELPAAIPCGCIFSNELFDALPVHRVVREQNELRELYVDVGPGGLCEVSGPASSAALHDYFREQGIALADGQQAEINLQACDWMADAGKRLQRGFVLTIDYGHEAAQLYDERHMRGTLLAYRRHRASEDFFRAPGEQDLTSHVNFTALERWGARSGLARTGFTSQCNFLLVLSRQSEFADLQSEAMSENERIRARLLFKTLIYPEGMGETFRVLVQHKNVESPRLSGLEPL